MMIYYNKCPICGKFHDDGALIQLVPNGKYYFICLDCADLENIVENLENIDKKIYKE